MPTLKLKKFSRGDFGGPDGKNFADSLALTGAAQTVTLPSPVVDTSYIVVFEVSLPAAGATVSVSAAGKGTTQFVCQSSAAATANWVMVA